MAADTLHLLHFVGLLNHAKDVVSDGPVLGRPLVAKSTDGPSCIHACMQHVQLVGTLAWPALCRERAGGTLHGLVGSQRVL